MYREQGLTDTPATMEARADDYRSEAFVQGGKVGKTQPQVLEDVTSKLQTELAALRAADTDQKREEHLKELNDKVEKCLSSPVSQNER